MLSRGEDKMVGNSSRKNAFTYFVEEYMAKEAALGRKITKKVARSECTVGWTELDPETRLKYCNMANPMLHRTDKSGRKIPTPENMEWLDPVTGEYGEKWFRYVRSGDELHYLKTTLDTEKKLRRFSLYLVHFNYFCQTSLKKYVPAELALLEFNLAEGIKNVYHTLINPGSIPLGYAHEAKKLSHDGHGIPIPPQTKGEKDMTKIIDSVKKFLQYGTGPTGKFPPLFTVVDNVLPAMHMLNDMVPYNEDQPVFTVYPTQRMFSWIKSKCSEISGKGENLMDEAMALLEIERDCFRYIVEIACDFHKQSETKFPMCSQSIVKRLAFTICDHCCRDLNITLVGGKHVHRSSSISSSASIDEESDETGDTEKKEKKEKTGDEFYDELAGLEESMASQCTCKVPDYVCGYSTKELPKEPFVGMTAKDMETYYSAYMHNVMEGKVDMDVEEELKEKDYLFLENTKYDFLREPPSLDVKPDGSLPTVAEQLAAYRYEEDRKLRNAVLARVQEREAREAQEAFERIKAQADAAKAAEASADGAETTSSDEIDKS